MRKLTLGLLLLIASVSSWAGEKWQITIAHTNDLHGWMMPFDYQTANPRFAQSEFVDSRYAAPSAGGLARRATLIKRLRKSVSHSFALIDGGDLFTRGPWHRTFFGIPEIEACNEMGYDAVCVGNNEFKATPDTASQNVLLGLVRRSRFPWLAANLTVGDSGVPVEGIHPFIVRRYGDMRVGFLGLTAPRSKDYPQTKGWTIEDPITAAQRWVPIARKECDVLIAVTHLGVEMDKQLAAKVSGIDAIVGGDSHTFLPRPEVVTGPTGASVPIVQDGGYGVCLGVLDLSFEKLGSWKLTRYAGRLVRVDARVTEDPDLKQTLSRWIPKPVVRKVGLRSQPLGLRNARSGPARNSSLGTRN